MPRSNLDLTKPGWRFRAFARFLLKGIAALITLAVVGLTLLLALLWREHGTELTLPFPTGHFAVGRTTYAWINDAQIDELAPSPDVKRELLVWIWYPSAADPSATPADYLPTQWRSAISRSSGPRSLPAVLMDDFFTRD